MRVFASSGFVLFFMEYILWKKIECLMGLSGLATSPIETDGFNLD